MILDRHESAAAAGVLVGMVVVFVWMVALLFMVLVVAVAAVVLCGWSGLHVLRLVRTPAPWARAAAEIGGIR